MLENDYIVRQVAQLVRALVRIVQHREAGDEVLAEQELESAVSGLTGMPLEDLLYMPTAALLAFVREPNDPSWQRERLLARLLCEHGRVCEKVGQLERAEQSLRHAFVLFDEAERNAGAPTEEGDQHEMAWLVERLS